jgi:hypothetical protein
MLLQLDAQVDLIIPSHFLTWTWLSILLSQFDADGKLAKALDARPLTNVVKDLEAKMKSEHSS